MHIKKHCFVGKASVDKPCTIGCRDFSMISDGVDEIYIGHDICFAGDNRIFAGGTVRKNAPGICGNANYEQ